MFHLEAPKKKSHRGFSLLEIVLTITVLAIAATMGGMVLTSTKAKALVVHKQMNNLLEARNCVSMWMYRNLIKKEYWKDLPNELKEANDVFNSLWKVEFPEVAGATIRTVRIDDHATACKKLKPEHSKTDTFCSSVTNKCYGYLVLVRVKVHPDTQEITGTSPEESTSYYEENFIFKHE